MEEGMMKALDNSLESELELILRQRDSRAVGVQERDLNMNRSGSAPPTVEGSLSAVGSLFRNSDHLQIDNRNSLGINGVLTEEELRSHPMYLAYYYAHGNFNPRLPPPLLSKEDWRVAQRFQVGGSNGEGNRDWWKKNVSSDGGSSSLFSMQPGLAIHKDAESELMEMRKAATGKTQTLPRKNSDEWIDRGDGLIGLTAPGMGSRRKSFADILQEGLEQPVSSSNRISRPASQNAISDVMNIRGISNSHSSSLCNEKETSEVMHSGAVSPDLSRFRNLNSAVPHSFAPAVGSSLSNSRKREPQLVRRAPSPGIPPVGSSMVRSADKQTVVGGPTLNDLRMSELTDVASSLSSLNLSKSRLPDGDNHSQSSYLDAINDQRLSYQHRVGDSSRKDNLGTNTKYLDISRENANIVDMNVRKSGIDGPVNFHRRAASSADLNSNRNMYEFAKLDGPSIHNQVDNLPGMDLSAQMPTRYPAANNHLASASSCLHSPAMDSVRGQYMMKSSEYANHGATSSGNLPRGKNNYVVSHGHEDMQALQKVYLEALLAQQNQQYGSPVFGRSGSLNHLYGNPTYGRGMPYQGNLVDNSALAGSRTLSQQERAIHFAPPFRNSVGAVPGSWNPQADINLDRRYASSLLDELKNNKTKSFELSDVVDHVIEFSTDQYGSRFIQQKLETATVEEKNLIFPEIIPHARSLMTDVFGNYVIQKFFEHGTKSQRRELANQLIGHVLPLSLQMYGCRVVQKALEVVDVDQQTQLVAELNGSVMKCVRDQNGNHVVQKCIECVSQDQIQFIVSSFFGQVVSLSSHPYGCRVIQRVLEHCDDPNTQVVMDEIMNSVCTLAQDQYGNYVIQHVLQHGKPHERSAVISKLTGQIVKMSLQKFASNVVEKCLTYGSPEERQILVNEMLGSTDENEPLQIIA
ncbi:Armadillo-like helical [Cynara cardunculus var. scolymus]|uniref:Armadillo-like helical n=1 Tax=Cynara cardunculus var. scolymus TaxID=59895 RepID=A0A103YIL2_CYNCS|nr:Armadillo-like helical [Cynara cardunculus var. scolymus]